MAMPKATTEGGASNAQVCAQCGAQVAWGAPRCPECPSTEFTETAAPPPPASAPKAEHVAYVAEALGVPEGEAAAMRKAELVELGQSAAADEPAVPPSPPVAPPRQDGA